MEKYKTIIIGAGPGGLRCAKILAEHKENFILFEKNSSIERKICTGMWGITPKTELMGLPDSLFENKFNKVLLSTPFRAIEVLKEKPYVATLNRKKLGDWQLDEAKKFGANIIFNYSVSEIGENFIIVNGRKIFFDNLVGADGSLSIVRRSLNLPIKTGFGIQYWIKIASKNMEIYFDSNKFGAWYAWIVPHNEITSIGTGGDLSITTVKKLKDNLDKWCKERGYDISSAKLEGAYINYDYRGYKFGNKYLVGDAAGLSSGLTGEGIYFAMASGEDIAKMIINKNHKPVLINKVLYIKKIHEIILNILKHGKYSQIFVYNFLLSLLKIKYFKNKIINLVG